MKRLIRSSKSIEYTPEQIEELRSIYAKIDEIKRMCDGRVEDMDTAQSNALSDTLRKISDKLDAAMVECLAFLD